MTIRVLIVDDSPVVRRALNSVFSKLDGVEVVGQASDPIQAREALKRLRPTVMTLDCEMPHMDGLTFLKEVMATRPLPVVMISTLTQKSSAVALEALRLGAVAAVSKPRKDYPIDRMLKDAKDALYAAARARVTGPRVQARPSAVTDPGEIPPAVARRHAILVGSSTGGTVAFESFASGLPMSAPCMLVSQHLPEAFIERFVERLRSVLPQQVSVANGSEPCLPGRIYVAPGHAHLRIRAAGSGFVTELFEAPPVNHHRPSVDVMMLKGASVLGNKAIGVILTGMGRDGARGLLRIRKSGGLTLCQDEETSVVYGMPKAAIELEAASRQGPPARLAGIICETLKGKARKAA